jgi:hypothetical protein
MFTVKKLLSVKVKVKVKENLSRGASYAIIGNISFGTPPPVKKIQFVKRI